LVKGNPLDLSNNASSGIIYGLFGITYCKTV